VLFSSPLEIENNTQMQLYIMVEILESNEDELNNTFIIDRVTFNHESSTRHFAIIFELNPNKIYYVPLKYAYHYKLYTSPINLKYMPTLIFDIRGYNLRKDEITPLICKHISTIPDSDSDLNHLKSDFQLMKLLTFNVNSHKNVMPTMHANHRVILFTPIKLYNCLPFDIRIDIYTQDNAQDSAYSTQLKQSENIHINLEYKKLDKFKLVIHDYLNLDWNTTLAWSSIIESNEEMHKLEFNLIPTTETQVSSKQLNLYLSYKKPNEYTLYSPYWLINKSGKPLLIKSVDTPTRVYHLYDETILMFDFKNYIKKKNLIKLSLKSDNNNNNNTDNKSWSDSFSLDTIGTTNMVNCKDDKKQRFTFLMRSTLSNSSRTKLITFAPFLSVVNQLEEPIEICEFNQHEQIAYKWQKVGSNMSDAFWLNESKFGFEKHSFCIKMGKYF
jgi:hypothetical protein